MKTITVAKAFSLILDPTQPKIELGVGVHEVEDAVADHWYTQQHLSGDGLGSEAYANDVRDQLIVAFSKARDAADDYDRLLGASHEADQAAGIAEREPPHVQFYRNQLRLAEIAEGERDADDETLPPVEEPAAEEPAEDPKPAETEEAPKPEETEQPAEEVVETEKAVEEAPPVEKPEAAAEESAPAAVEAAAAEDAPAAFHPLDGDHNGQPGGSLPDGYRWSNAEETGEAEAPFIVHDESGDRVADTVEQLREHISADKAHDAPEEAPAEVIDFDAKTDDELRAFIKERDGKAANGRAGRDKLLALARGETADTEEQA